MRWARHFPRPLALVATRAEIPVAVACILLMVGIFAADVLEPPRRVIGIIDVVPMLAAAWLLSMPIAAIVCATGLVLLIVTGLIGVVDWVTVSIEVITFLVVAGVARLYAESLLKMLRFPLRRLSLAAAVPQGLDALSQREREVVRLAAEGLTAREIGTRLFIGERTVETHLAHAYAKLGINSRIELIKMASRLSL